MGLVLAQESTKNGSDSGASFPYKIPSNAIPGSTAERRDAWNKLSESEKASASKRLQEMVEKAKSQSAQQNLEPTSLDLSIVDDLGQSNIVNATASRNFSLEFFDSSNARLNDCEGCFPSRDADKDGDGFFESFEEDLEFGFTPYYHVSAGEDAGTGFARFYDSVPQTVSQIF